MSYQSYKSLEIHPDYVLVLEFLNSSNPREILTGTKLVDHWNQKYPDKFPMEIRTCETGEQLLEEIRKATQLVPAKGIPIIHIESHGSEWIKDELNNEKMAYFVRDKENFLSLDTVWDALRPLNIATDFNLMVVAVSCYGDEIRRGIVQHLWNDKNKEDCKPIPFMASIGFDEEVEVEFLLEAMILFYEKLLINGCSLQEAVSNANQQLNSSGKLMVQWTVKTLLDAVIINFTVDREKFVDSCYEIYRNENSPPYKSKEEFHAGLISHEKAEMNKMLKMFFAYESHPHNQERFGIFVQ